MRKILAVLCVIFFALLLPAAERTWEPLPVPLSNNAVATAKVGHRLYMFSFMGIGPRKTWDAISNQTFAYNVDSGKWDEWRPVPGPAGRIAAAAIGMRDVVYRMGGYTVDGRGEETSVHSVEVLLPSKGIWYRAGDMPMSLDDSVLGVYRDRYIYTVSGWSQNNAVSNVQVYDSAKDKWQQATPIPGTPVFGHAGGMVNDTIVYVDGAYKNPAGRSPKYVASDECWMGKVDSHDITRIKWSKLPNHPGKARYRIAAGASEHDQKIYFSGGTDNPYNFDGIGFDGKPAEPSLVTFAWNLKTGKWEVINEKTPNPTMDNRGLLVTPYGLIRIGGMEAGQKVTAKVSAIPRSAK